MKPEVVRKLSGEAVSILAAALVLGFTFNRVSPLGVRPGPILDPPVDGTQSGKLSFENQTISLSFESMAAPRAAANPYRNETIAIEPVSARANPPPPLRVKTEVGSLTWSQVKRLLASHRAVLIDARTAEAYRADHIPGAISLPAQHSAEEILTFKRSYPQSTPLVVYCASAQCPLSRQLSKELMEQHGYQEVSDMPGGYAEWRLAESAPAAKAGGAK
jgi:rhodanese-related sulfurtransferase